MIRDFIEAMDSPGGQVLVCLFLVYSVPLLQYFHTPKAEDIVPFALGILSRSMIGKVKGATDGATR